MTAEHTISRRSVLRLSLMGIGALGGAGIGLVTLSAPGAASASHPTGVLAPDVLPVPEPAPPHPRPAPLPPEPVRHPLPQRPIEQRVAGPWPTPIYSIDDFLRRSPHTRMRSNAIMLTVDDGPDPEWTPKYLRLFARYGVRATFFMIGREVAAYPHLARSVASDGHVVGNHTWTHDESLPSRTLARIRSEIGRTNDAIAHATGVRPTQFRAPGGAWGPRVIEVLAEQRMLPVGWDIDPRDWTRPGTAAITRAMLAAGRHDIILCHDGGGDRSQTYAALQTVIPRLRSEGYVFVTLPSR